MANRTYSTLFWQKTLLAAAGALMLLAVLNQPFTLLSFTSPQGLVSTALIAYAGFFAAKGIRELAGVFLQRSNYPWYLRPRAFIFLAIILFVITVLLRLLDGLVSKTFTLTSSSSCGTRILEFIAFVLFWTVLIKLPYQNTYTDSSRTKEHKQPQFTYFKRNTFKKI
jgi:hypothetical protein